MSAAVATLCHCSTKNISCVNFYVTLNTSQPKEYGMKQFYTT